MKYKIETTFAAIEISVKNNLIIECPKKHIWMYYKKLDYIIESLKKSKHFVSLIEI